MFKDRRATPDHSPLGQLGRHSSDDPRHPGVADDMVLSVSHGCGGFNLKGAAECRDRLVATLTGANGLTSTLMTNSQLSPTQCGSAQMEECSSTTRCGPVPTEQALVRSQRGPMAGIPPLFSCRVLILSVSGSFSCAASGACFTSRLLSAVWPTTRFSWPPLCSVCDIRVGRRGFPLESCAVRVCREAVARVSTNIRQDLDYLPEFQLMNAAWRLSHGLPLFHGAQLAVDTTLVCTIRVDGAPKTVWPLLVVLACEIGGRWSDEVHDFLGQLVRARARSERREICAIARRP